MGNMVWKEAQNDSLLSHPELYSVSLSEILLWHEEHESQKLFTEMEYFMSKLQLSHKGK